MRRRGKRQRSDAKGGTEKKQPTYQSGVTSSFANLFPQTQLCILLVPIPSNGLIIRLLSNRTPLIPTNRTTSTQLRVLKQGWDTGVESGNGEPSLSNYILEEGVTVPREP